MEGRNPDRALKKPLFFYGWWVTVAAAVILSVASGFGFWAFSVFIRPLEQEFGWSRAQVSGTMSFSILMMGLLGPLVGRLTDRLGARPLVIGGAIASGLSYFLFYSITSLWQLYLLQMLAALGRSFMAFLPLTALLSNWFVRQRGVAIGVAQAGVGLGGLLYVPLSSLFISTIGWRWAYVVFGAVTLVLVLPLAWWVLRSNPAEMGLLPDGDTVKPGEGREATTSSAVRGTARRWDGMSVREAMGGSAFWLFSISFALIFTSQISVNLHMVPFLVTKGMEAGTAALVLGYQAGLSIVGRLTFGYLADRVASAKVLLLMVLLGLTVVTLLAANVTEGVGIWGFVLVFGFAMGAAPILQPVLLARSFGMRSFGALLGVMWVLETAGTTLGPVLAGYIYDVTRGYQISFTLFSFLLLLAVGALGFIRIPRKEVI